MSTCRKAPLPLGYLQTSVGARPTAPWGLPIRIRSILLKRKRRLKKKSISVDRRLAINCIQFYNSMGVPFPNALIFHRSACSSCRADRPTPRLTIKYKEAIASRSALVAGDDAVADGISHASGLPPSLPGRGLGRKGAYAL